LDQEKVVLFFKTGDLLKEVQFISNFLWQDKKRQPFNIHFQVIIIANISILIDSAIL
jgi:hypothetical protein